MICKFKNPIYSIGFPETIEKFPTGRKERSSLSSTQLDAASVDGDGISKKLA
jgi:hypothetical protein